MGKRNAPLPSGQLVHLVLRGHRPQTLVQTDDDWRALGVCASRMLFWCGGTIYGCRCDRTRIHFALQIAHASIGAMAHTCRRPTPLISGIAGVGVTSYSTTISSFHCRMRFFSTIW